MLRLSQLKLKLCTMSFYISIEKGGGLHWFELEKIRLHPSICSKCWEKYTPPFFFSLLKCIVLRYEMLCSSSNALLWGMTWYVCVCISFEPICSIKLVNYSVLAIIIQNFIFSCCFNIFWQWWICWQSHCWCIGEDRSWWYNKNWVIIFNIYYSWSAGRNEGTFMLS